MHDNILDIRKKIDFDYFTDHNKNINSDKIGFNDFDVAFFFLKQDKRLQDNVRRCKSI